jgi:acyl-coenzyme A thioesterase PaaI-like protein
MKTSFFRPARGRVVARGRVLHRSTTMAYCEADLVDAEGLLVAKALGTIKFLTRFDAADKL